MDSSVRSAHQPTTTGPTWTRLEDQIAWYDGKSASAQRAFKRLKVLQLVTAATVAVVAAADVVPWITAAIAGAVLILEGLQQLGQYQANWIAYRSTCETLRHEKYLYLAGAGHYAASANPTQLLAEKVEGLVSQEHAKWASAREEAPKREA
jgi:hypothetical protein